MNGNTSGFALVRYNVNGTLDTRFGVRGKITTQFDGFLQPRSVALQPDGKIVVGGDIFISGHTSNGAFHLFAVERFDATGAFDRTFGKGGLMLANVSADADGRKSQDVINGMVLQDDGKIVAAGSTLFGTAIDVSDVALARFQP